MSPDTKAPTTTSKSIEEFCRNAAETFDRMLTEDEIARRCFRDCCFALLDRLGMRRHSLLDMAGPGIPRPTADQTERLLQRFAEVVKERHPRFCEVYEEELLSLLQRYSYEWLARNAGYEESRDILDAKVKKIPHAVTRQWDNPVRFVTDPVTAKHTLGDLDGRTPPTFFLRAQAFLRGLEPAGPAKKRGRPKGSSKPVGSGRKIVDPELCREAWKAKQQPEKNKSRPWWLTFARKNNLTIPEDAKPLDALRKRLEEWALKGKTLAYKKAGG